MYKDPAILKNIQRNEVKDVFSKLNVSHRFEDNIDNNKSSYILKTENDQISSRIFENFPIKPEK